MKINIGKYPKRLTCNVYERHMNNKYGIMNWPEQGDFADYYMEAVDKFYQDVYNFFNTLWFDRRTQKQTIRIDKQDTWSMDSTLAPIILPMLKQLKETKHGSPFVENADVPKELRITPKQRKVYLSNNETDPKWFDRWDYVLDEMIWAFEQKSKDNWQSEYYGEWKESEDDGPLGSFEWTDDEGRQAHQERMTNGFKLFGKYYESLWD
jgi:hypothetical protein